MVTNDIKSPNRLTVRPPWAESLANSKQNPWNCDLGSGKGKTQGTANIDHHSKLTAETIKVIGQGNCHCFLMCWRLPVTIATYILTSSPMKQRFRSSPAHSCTPTMPKMKKTKKHSASTLPSIGSVSKRRVTRIRIPSNKHSTISMRWKPLC